MWNLKLTESPNSNLVLAKQTLPSCAEYKELLDTLHKLTGWDYEEMRLKYGAHTYGQWFRVLAENTKNMPVTYHRNPTQSEIKFGYGATHYRDFELADCLTDDGRLKKWFVAKDDGLRYYR